jgi:hypothetical protein
MASIEVSRQDLTTASLNFTAKMLLKAVVPEIKLMHGNIVNVRRVRILSQVGYGLSETFLLVSNIVFRTCKYTSILNALDCLCERNTGQNWIGTEA